jgi:decaprenylphospho-beta-D-ribofuranose 2-oxidase
MTGRQSDRMAAQTESGSDAREQPVSRRTPGLQSLSGWGNWPITGSEVVAPTSARELLDIVPLRTGQIARGLGRSYGDAAQLAGGTVIDMTGLRGIQLDTEKGIATARPGHHSGRSSTSPSPTGGFSRSRPARAM